MAKNVPISRTSTYELANEADLSQKPAADRPAKPEKLLPLNPRKWFTCQLSDNTRQVTVFFLWIMLATANLNLVMQRMPARLAQLHGQDIYSKTGLPSNLIVYLVTILAAVIFGLLGRAGLRVNIVGCIANALLVVGNLLHLLTTNITGAVIGNVLGSVGLGVYGLLLAEFVYVISVVRRLSLIASLTTVRQIVLIVCLGYILGARSLDLHVHSESANQTAIANNPTLSPEVAALVRPQLTRYSLAAMTLLTLWLLHILLIAFVYPSLRWACLNNKAMETDSNTSSKDDNSSQATKPSYCGSWRISMQMIYRKPVEGPGADQPVCSPPTAVFSNCSAFLAALLQPAAVVLVTAIWVSNFADESTIHLTSRLLMTKLAWQTHQVEFGLLSTYMLKAIFCLVIYRMGTLQYKEAKLALTGLVFQVIGLLIMGILTMPIVEIPKQQLVNVILLPSLLKALGVMLTQISCLSLYTKLLTPGDMYLRLSIVYAIMNLSLAMGGSLLILLPERLTYAGYFVLSGISLLALLLLGVWSHKSSELDEQRQKEIEVKPSALAEQLEAKQTVDNLDYSL